MHYFSSWVRTELFSSQQNWAGIITAFWRHLMTPRESQGHHFVTTAAQISLWGDMWHQLGLVSKRAALRHFAPREAKFGSPVAATMLQPRPKSHSMFCFNMDPPTN